VREISDKMEKVITTLVSVLSLTLASTRGDIEYSVTHVNDFLTQCVDLAGLGIGLQCVGLDCVGEEASSLSLEDLQRQECVTDDDCLHKQTGMRCSVGRCDCPPYAALNLTSCACQAASHCDPSEITESETGEMTRCTEHNGRRCADSFCSCFSSPDFTDLLVDPTSLFCVLAGGPDEPGLGEGGNSIGLAVLGALIGFLAVVLIAVFIVATYKNCVCDRGDYKCDDPDGNLPEHHIAAWDHPSMDYISKDDENIIFTLCQASDSVRQSNASTIYVQDEETTTYIQSSPSRTTEHENMAYVQDDEPRND